MALHSLLKGGWSEVGVSLFSQVATKETAPNCTRRGSDCMLQKILHRKDCQTLEQTVQGDGRVTIPGGI